MAKIEFENLSKIREKHKNERVVFCSGVFDLTHAGHVLFFEDCKKHGDILVVMVGNDLVVKRNKQDKRPILNEHLRLKLVDTLKPVDYSFLDELAPDETHPLDYIDHVFRELKPDAYVVNEDAFDMPYREALVKKHETKLIVLERVCPPEFEKISTTKIIKKIKELD